MIFFSRLLQIYHKYEWKVIIFLFLLSTTLGFFSLIPQRDSVLDALYDTIRLYTLESFEIEDRNLLYQIARWTSPLAAVLLVYSSFILLARDKIVMQQLRYIKGHTIICGLGKVGQQIAEAFLNEGKKLVIIESDDNNDYISYYKDKNVVVLTENAADPMVLRKARVSHAKNIIAVTHYDKLNIEIINHAINIVNDENITLKCLAHINDDSMRDLFITQNFLDKRITLFNINEIGIRIMLKKYGPDILKPIFGSDESKAILIIGFGNIGFNLLKQLCNIAHYINNKPSNIFVIANVYQKIDIFDNYIKKFKEFNLIDISFYKIKFNELNTDSLRNITFDKKFDGAYLCIDDEIKQFEIAVNIEKYFIENSLPLVFCMPIQSQLTILFEKRFINKNGKKIFHIFKIVEESCKYSYLINEELMVYAKLCHELYRKKNPKAPQWEDLDYFNQLSNIFQADHIEVKLRAIKMSLTSFDEEEYNKILYNEQKLELLAEMEHRRWMAFHILNNKTNHRCLVNWDQLDETDKEFDREHIKSLPDIIQKRSNLTEKS